MAWIGTSGWAYPEWKTGFYAGVRQKAWLAHAARTFETLEINGSFYVQIKPDTYRRWASETPDGFRFALKAHRYITHYKQLIDVAPSIELQRDAARALGAKLTVVLWQLPSRLAVDLARLDGWLAALASWPEVRHALEPRHASWFCASVEDRLAAAGVAACMSHAPDFPMWRAVTTDVVYVRLHGAPHKYVSRYGPASLRRWADDVARWQAEGRTVYVYFDNTARGEATRDALALRELVTPAAGAVPSPARRAATY